MFFENDLLSFNILDVMELKQGKVNMLNKGRNYNALSFRFRSDAVLKTEGGDCYMKDNFVSYVPARLNYSRVATKDELIAIHFDTTNYHTKEIECFEYSFSDKLGKLFSEILLHWNKKEAGYKYRCSAILCRIFEECYIYNYDPKPHGSRIRKSVDYLRENYTKSGITIKEIAEKSFMSEVYFRKLFKEELGTSPQK